MALTEAEARRLAPIAAALAAATTPAAGPRLEPVAGDLPGGSRAGLLAGTFNPLTRAHTALAVAGRRAGLDRVVLALAPVSLDKEGVVRAHPIDRLDWAGAWARRHRWAVVAVSNRPLLVDMAEALAARTGKAAVLLVGADKAAQLVDARYYDDLGGALARLERAATVLVADRAGHRPPDPRLRAARLATPGWAAERSATEARAAAAAGRPLRALLPAVVARAVERTGAYDEDPVRYLARVRALDALLVRGP